MKWLAVMLLIANIALWFYCGRGSGVSTEIQVEGRLPRVTGLEIVPAGRSDERPVQSPQHEAEEQSRASNDQESLLASGKGAADFENSGLPETNATERSELCVEIGWFEDETSARDAAGNLGVTEKIKRIRTVERPQAPFHWVIVPPAPSRSDANQRYREIQSMGIDAYLVVQGEQENSISLGLFESRTAAERILTRRKAQGLNARLVTFPRNRISYALVFSAVLRSGTEADKSLLGGEKARFESVKFSECEGVATTDKNP